VVSNERRIREVLPLRQRISRTVSVLAGYAMRPQLTMAALLLLMIGASLFLVRSHPPDRDLVQVTERGVQEGEVDVRRSKNNLAAASPTGRDLAPLLEPAPSVSAEKCIGTSNSGCGKPRKDEGTTPKTEHDQPSSLEAEYRSARQLRFSSGCSAAVQNFEDIRRRQPKSDVGLAATWQAADCYSKLNRKEEARALLGLLLDSPEYSQRATAQLKALGEM
jgi:hypothetical protein